MFITFAVGFVDQLWDNFWALVREEIVGTVIAAVCGLVLASTLHRLCRLLYRSGQLAKRLQEQGRASPAQAMARRRYQGVTIIFVAMLGAMTVPLIMVALRAPIMFSVAAAAAALLVVGRLQPYTTLPDD